MRGCCWSIILFQFLWLNVVIPGHTRGMITVPGSFANCAPEPSAEVCCPITAGGDRDNENTPTPEQRRCCAVCYVAAGYTLPPIFQIDLTPADLIHDAPQRAVTQVASHHTPLPYFPNGPPTPAAAHRFV